MFGGWENVSKKYDVAYQTIEGDYDGRPQYMLVYSPSRTVAVYAPAEYCHSHRRPATHRASPAWASRAGDPTSRTEGCSCERALLLQAPRTCTAMQIMWQTI